MTTASAYIEDTAGNHQQISTAAERSVSNAVSEYLDYKLPEARNLIVQEWHIAREGKDALRIVGVYQFASPHYRQLTPFYTAQAMRELGGFRQIDVKCWLNRSWTYRVRNPRTDSFKTRTRKVKTFLPLKAKELESFVAFKVDAGFDASAVTRILDGTRMDAWCGLCEDWLSDMRRGDIGKHFQAHADAVAYWCEACELPYESAAAAADHFASDCPLEVEYDQDDCEPQFAEVEDEDEVDAITDDVAPEVDDTAVCEPELDADASEPAQDAPSEEPSVDDAADAWSAEQHGNARCAECGEVFSVYDAEAAMTHSTASCVN